MENGMIGFVSNFIPTICFYPLDTIMVRYQTNKAQMRTKHVFSGAVMASINNSVCHAVVFSLYNEPSRAAHSWWKAGLLSGILLQPFENIKISRQIQQTPTFTFAFMTKGISLCVAKEMIAIPVYFQTYDTLCHENDSLMTTYGLGGLAGIHSWIWSYPLTTIKAKYILDQKICLNVSSLYKGFSFCAIRSFFFNGFYFSIMQALRSEKIFQF